jgi:uncharacterized membrane protein
MTAVVSRFRILSLGSLAALSLAPLSIAACDGRLEVTDEDLGGAAGSSNQAGSGGSSGSAGSSGTSGDPVSCNDGVRNGDEEDVDCGGASCPACPGESPCTNGPLECDSYICLDGVCQPPTCADGVRNGDEEDVDCGGGNCGPCSTLCHEQCAVSAALIPLGCDPSAPKPIGVASQPRSNDDGSLIAFEYCYEDSRCTPMYWSATEGVRAFAVSGGGTLAGMSADGQLVLVSPQLALGGDSLLFAPDGSSQPSGMGPTPALVSADGALVGVSPTTNNAFALLRRPRGGQIEPLGDLPFGSNEFALSGVSPDASVIVGYSYQTSFQPFRYAPGDGLVFGLEGLPATADGATINALSRDGQVFAGITLLGNDQQNVFRWTEADGVVELAPVTPSTPGIDPSSMALSDDGSVLVYSRETNSATDDFGAFRWDTQRGAQALTPGIQSTASLVSGDGRVIIGQTLDTEDYRGFLWTEGGGARSIRSALETAGVDLTGWSLGTPRSLSRDGKVALGVGRCGELTTVYRLLLPE